MNLDFNSFLDTINFDMQDRELTNLLNKINNNYKSKKDYKSKNIKLHNHIENLHYLIFSEISNNGIQSEFLNKLRIEINNYELENN